MNWAYVAAFLDADGSIMTPGSSRYCCIEWAQHTKNNHVLYEMREFLARWGVDGRIYIYRTNQCSVLRVRRNDDVVFCLQKVLPWLRVKESKALETMKFLQQKDAQQFCKNCGLPLYRRNEKRFKPRKFCSGRCRTANYRQQTVVK
jgi:intein/homing endonuclease